MEEGVAGLLAAPTGGVAHARTCTYILSRKPGRDQGAVPEPHEGVLRSGMGTGHGVSSLWVLSGSCGSN